MSVAVLLAATLAWTQESTPTSRCADARAGDEIEVCLNEAAKNPDAVSAIASALRAHIDRGTTADRELLGALLILMSEETGIEGTERLAALADPRAVVPLIHAAERRELPVAIAAVAAVAVYDDALAHLTRWLRDEDEREEIRLASADALGHLRTTKAADSLVDTLRRPGIDADIRRRMYAVVSANYPSRLDELKGQVSVNGAPWVTAGSTWALGYSMTAAGYIGKTDGALAPLGAITGGVAGGTAGYLYSRAWPVEAGDAALISSAGFMGTVSGIFIGSGLEADDPTGAAYLGGLGGEVLGYGLGIGLQKQYNGQARDSWEAMGIGLLSGTVVGSAAAFQRQRTDNPNPRTVTPEIGAGLAIGTAIGHVAAPRVDIGKMDMALIGVSSSYGLAFGSLVPTTGGFRQGLPTFGLSAGALMGYGLSGAIEPQPDVVIGAITGGAFGGFFGAGVAQVAAPYDFQATQGTALAGITAGMALGGYFSHVNPDPIDDRDVVMTTMTTSWAAWQTTGWSIYAGSNASQPGPVYIIPTAVGATNAAVSGELDIPVTHSSAALSLGLWGAYAGGASAQLTGADPLLFALVGSDVALVGGVVLMSPLVGAPPLVIGLADAGGVLGGSTAALGTSIAIDNSDTILIASLIGSGAGLAGGAVIGTIWHQSGTSRNIALRLPRVRVPGRWSIAPTQLPGRDEPVLGVRMAIDQW